MAQSDHLEILVVAAELHPVKKAKEEQLIHYVVQNKIR